MWDNFFFFILIHYEFLKIEDLNMFPKADIHPIVFDEIYILDKKNENSTVAKKQKKTIENKSAPNGFE